jgi:hypothetical protein
MSPGTGNIFGACVKKDLYWIVLSGTTVGTDVSGITINTCVIFHSSCVYSIYFEIQYGTYSISD